MDVSLVIRKRLQELQLEQRELAAAAEVTESYVSQLLNRKKLPPAPGRTDIYEKMEKLLKLPPGDLSKLADLQRREELKRNFAEPPVPLLGEVRELMIRKCRPSKASQVRAIFEKQPIGELERFVVQKLLDVVKAVSKEELSNENWLHLVARLSGRSYQQMRVIMLEFLDTDVFSISAENCISFLDPLIEYWDIDLATFAMEIVLAPRLAPGYSKRFEFVEAETVREQEVAGFREFLRDKTLSDTASEEEIRFLKQLRFKGKRPTALYYYRELQSLRDPLHFLPAQQPAAFEPEATGHRQGAEEEEPNKRTPREQAVAPMQKHREAHGIEKQMKQQTHKAAMRRWKKSRTARPARKRGKS